MRTVVTPPFRRALKRVLRANPSLSPQIERVLRQLEEDPWHPTLSTHKLKGPLAPLWACTVGYDLRILMEFIHHPDTGEPEIALVTLGSHDEVY